MFVPVIGQDQQPLIPTTPARARQWIKSGKATPFWKGGIFCIRLNVEPSTREVQPIAVGIDPGSKREGYSVVSAAHTYVNIQAEAREGVKEAEKDSSRMRRTRRKRKTPCRQPGKLSLHHPETNKRLTQTASVADCTLITLLRWRTRLVPLAQLPASPAPKKGHLLPPLAQAEGYPQDGVS